jgi:uncharacterized membrane protein
VNTTIAPLTGRLRIRDRALICMAVAIAWLFMAIMWLIILAAIFAFIMLFGFIIQGGPSPEALEVLTR